MADRPQTPVAPSPSPSPSNYYLRAYNFVSATYWFVILARVARFVIEHGFEHVYAGVGDKAKWVQTMAVLEIAHAAIGLVRAPLLTTAMQVASRLLLVWGIVNNFPAETSTSFLYTSMLVAWSVTEVIRYSFFATNLFMGSVPEWLRWLRYNAFFVLYPLGISSECGLVYKSIAPAESWNVAYGYVLKAILLVYIPGSYVLFTHMMAQRRKVMKGKASHVKASKSQ